MNLPAWEHFHHEADVGIRGMGNTLSEAFEQAALAMIAVVIAPENILLRQSVTISISAPDHEFLLTEWLNSLIYEMAVRRLLFGHFEVSIQNHSLHALAWGEPIDLTRHQPAVELKGATLTELKVQQTDKGYWIAQCVVDV